MKKVFALFIAIAMLITMFPVNAVVAKNSNEIKVGDEILFGEYNGSQIKWICADINENGYLMFAEDVICIKEFDKEGASTQYHSDGWGSVRKNSGSNCWQDSNIRQWLNTNGSVEYSHCNPSYSEEAGFLSCFTDYELNLIVSYKHMVTINEYETHRAGYCDGGQRETTDIYSISSFPSDISPFYHKTLNDRFFLIGQPEINKIYKNLGINAFKASDSYFINVPNNNGASYENIEMISSTASVGVVGSNSKRGIRPAFYLNPNYQHSYNIVSGTFESYVIGVSPSETPNGKAQAWISSITVDGKAYDVDGQLLPFKSEKLDTYDKYIGQKIAFILTNNIVTKIKFASEIKTNLNCTISSDKDNLTYTNGKYSDKELNLKVLINNCASGDNALGVGLDELGVYVESVTLTTSNKNLLTFNKGWWIFNGDGDSEITIPVNKTISCGDSQGIVSLKDIPDISAKLDVNTSHKISKDNASEAATITCLIKGSQNGKSFFGSGSRTFTVLNNDYYEPSSVSDLDIAAANALGGVQGSMTLADMDLNGSLSKLCTREQLKQVENLLFCAVALYQCPKKSFSEYLDDKIIEKVFGVQTNLIGRYNGKVCLTTYIKNENYGKLEIQFTVDFSKYSLSGIDIGALGFDVKYNVTGGSGKKNIPSDISQSGSCGMVAQVNMKNFCNAIEKVALSELKKAYNKGRGDDLNKAVDVLFGKTFNTVLKNAKKLHIIDVGSVSDIEWSMLTMAKTKYTIKCPVDVYIYDASGNTAASVVGDKVTINDSNIDITLNGDIKNVTSYGGDYTFEYIPTAKGTLDIEVGEYANNAQQLRAVTIENIPLEIGKIYKQRTDGKLFNDSDYSLIENEGTKFAHTSDVDCVHNHVTNEEWKESGYGYKYSLCSLCNDWIIESSNVFYKVKSVAVSDISLNYKQSTTLKPTIKADDGAKYKVEYSTSNAKVATVDKNGKVTATKRGSGTATITCTVIDSNGNVVKDTCKVNVSLTWWQWIIIIALFGWIWY